MNDDPKTSECVIVWTTVAEETAANHMARTLVESALAACVQVEAGITSHYRWNGKLCRETEYRLAIKTHRSRIDTVLDWLSQHHPYDEAEVLVTPVLRASAGYEQFVSLQVGGDGLSS